MAMKYKDRKDIVLSVSRIHTRAIEGFFNKTVVIFSSPNPNVHEYNFKINGFPTHFIVNKKGLLRK
jgi:hypothetical protein